MWMAYAMFVGVLTWKMMNMMATFMMRKRKSCLHPGCAHHHNLVGDVNRHHSPEEDHHLADEVHRRLEEEARHHRIVDVAPNNPRYWVLLLVWQKRLPT